MLKLSPENVFAALLSIESALPDLVGSMWSQIQPQYHTLRTQLECTTELLQMRAAAELVELLSPYAAARKRLHDALVAQTKAGAIMLALANLAKQIGLDSTVTKQLQNVAPTSSSQRFIWQSTPTKATSFKLGNVIISFEFDVFSEFIAGLITTSIKDVIGEANGVLRAAGALLIIASLYKATTIKLDEPEATVFYGFAQAGQEARMHLISTHTNRVRKTLGLKALKKKELCSALHKLAEFRIIERRKGTTDVWRIIEDHKIKSLS